MSDEETNILATVTPVIYLLLDRLVIVWAGGNRIPVKRQELEPWLSPAE